jgi:hypothetical protein
VTKLNHQIEQYSSSNGQLVAWVQLTTFSSTVDTAIYLYYGNGSATNQQNPAGVWSASYQGVWHLFDAFSGTAADSTSNANNATSFFYNVPTLDSTAQIYEASTFASSNQEAVQTPSISGVAGAAKYTLSGWYQRAAAGDTVGVRRNAAPAARRRFPAGVLDSAVVPMRERT